MVKLDEEVCFVADVLPIEQLENRLREDLEDAEQQWRNATGREKPEARRQFLQALHRLTVFVFEGTLEP